MIRESITLDDVIEYLNQLIKADPGAAGVFFNTRVPTNNRLEDFPPDMKMFESVPGTHLYGVIGVLNGLFGSFYDSDRKHWGAISINTDKDNHYKVYSASRLDKVKRKNPLVTRAKKVRLK